jgi:hypothetical protein
MQLVDGQRVMIFDPTGTTQRVGTVGAGALTISSHTNTTVTFSTDMPSDMVSGDIICPETSLGGATGIKGVPFIVNDAGNYYGQSRSCHDGLEVNGHHGLGRSFRRAPDEDLQSDGAEGGQVGRGRRGLADDVHQHHAAHGLLRSDDRDRQHVISTRTRQASGPVSTWAARACSSPGSGLPSSGSSGSTVEASTSSTLNGNLKMAVLKEVGQLLDMPAADWLQAINGTTSNYKASRQMWMDFAGDLYSPSLISSATCQRWMSPTCLSRRAKVRSDLTGWQSSASEPKLPNLKKEKLMQPATKATQRRGFSLLESLCSCAAQA